MLSTGHDSRAIANIFVEKAQKSGQRLTIMPLVKYVYLSHGWALGYIGKPLICHRVEAWRHGPVIPEVYEAFRPQGFYMIRKAYPILPGGRGPDYETMLNPEEQEVVDTIYEKYAKISAFALSEMTHREGTPWHQCKEGPRSLIPNHVIKKYYRGRLDAYDDS